MWLLGALSWALAFAVAVSTRLGPAFTVTPIVIEKVHDLTTRVPITNKALEKNKGQ